LSRKRDAAENLGRRIGNENPPLTPESSRVSENEEWAWMVDEDPTFYLSKTGRAEDTGR
jgi:hypothetical protein